MSARSSLANPAAVFLERYAVELDELANGMGSLQTTIAEIGGKGVSAELVERCQALDELTQRAEALAMIAHRLAATRMEDTLSTQDLVAGIRLGGLVQRLTGGPDSSRAVRSGEIEVF